MERDTEVKYPVFKFDKKLIEGISKDIAESISSELYYKLMLLRYIPEITAIKEGKLKTTPISAFKKKLLS